MELLGINLSFTSATCLWQASVTIKNEEKGSLTGTEVVDCKEEAIYSAICKALGIELEPFSSEKTGRKLVAFTRELVSKLSSSRPTD